MTKPLAKSLHTVTAVVRVAQMIATYERINDPDSLIPAALEALGYHGAADPYDLAGHARKALAKALAA